MNAFESPTSRENGRHSRKGAVWVMFSMKSWHPTVVKLVDNVESKGCGNGVGRTGAVHGTLVLLESTWVGADVADGARERSVPVGCELSTVVATDVAGTGSGAA